jgi:hypothetical protein
MEILTGIPTRVTTNVQTIRKFRSFFRNFLHVWSNVVLKKYPISGVLINRDTVEIQSEVHLQMPLLGIKLVNYVNKSDVSEFETSGKKVKMTGLKFGGDLGTWVNPYDLNVRDRVVVYIGASIGDTGLNFVYQGAESVIAIEPDPFTFELLQRNIELNRMQQTIIPINAALSGHIGSIKIPYKV